MAAPALPLHSASDEAHACRSWHWHEARACALPAGLQWDNFLHLLQPISSAMPYMPSAGNHELNELVPNATDPGGECGVPYALRLPMPLPLPKGAPVAPTPGSPPPVLWYSVDQGPVHFLQLCSDTNFSRGSEQWQ